MFNADDLRDVSVVLVNAVYFKGKWANKFNPELTKLAPFYTDEKNWKNVSMMQRHGSFYWGRIREFSAQFIELPYEVNIHRLDNKFLCLKIINLNFIESYFLIKILSL